MTRLVDLGVEFMVSVNGATLCREPVSADAIVIVTAKPRGKYKLVWPCYLEGRLSTACPICCYENGIDVANPRPQHTKADGSPFGKEEYHIFH